MSSSTSDDGDFGGEPSSSSSAPDRSLYAALNVRPDASEDEIRRAYRQLATTYHPDKAQDESLHADATLAFHRIQEAYEVLSDPVKRDIYDVYGLEGVRSGLELSVPGKTPEEMRKEWEAARAKRQQEEIDAAVNFRGQYQFRVDATALVSPYDRNLSRIPELKTISMTSGIDIPVESTKHWGPLASESDTIHLGGFAYVRGDHGGGSFLAGYKRVYADYTTFELHGMAGLKTLVSAQTSVQLSAAASATMAASWQPGRGLGLQLVTSRQLGEATNGEVSWVVGPRDEAGMGLTVTHRPNEQTQLSGRIEVGASTGITLRVARKIADDSTARAGVKLGASDIECDVGATKRVSEISTAGLSVVTGLKGIMLKVRYSRAGHLFEFPIQLTAGFDPGVLLAAHVLPPLGVYIANNWVIKPLGRLIEARKVNEARRHRAEEIKEAARQAAAAARLMEPVAKRKMQKEAAVQGLVIALALYGEEEAVNQVAAETLVQSAVAAAGANASSKEDEIEPAEEPSAAESNITIEKESSSGFTLQMHEELPPAVIDVTVGMQYLVDSTRLVLHQGYSKAGLMGFCDPAPSATSKLLLVYYMYQGNAYVAKISDKEGAVLPARGKLMDDQSQQELVSRIVNTFG